MNDHLLFRVLETIADAVKLYEPLLQAKLTVFHKALEQSQERKPTGGQTSAASRALNVLRHPFLKTTNHVKAKGVAAALVEKTGAKSAKLLGSAVTAWLVHEQAKLELSLFDSTSDVVAPSREAVLIESKGDVLRFLEKIAAGGVAPYMLGRLYDYQIAFIAKLISDAIRDREFTDPDNCWVQLSRSGFLTAFSGQMPEDEAILLAEVETLRSRPDSVRLREQIEKRFGRTLNVTPGFVEGCHALLERGGELSDQEAEALFMAAGRRYQAMTEDVRKLLGLSPAETKKVDAVIHFIIGTGFNLNHAREEDYRLKFAAHNLSRIVEHLEDGRRPATDWLPAINQVFLHEGSFIDRQVADETAFDMVLAYVLEKSRSGRSAEDREQTRRHIEEQAFREHVEDILKRKGLPYFLTEDEQLVQGVPEEHPYYSPEEITFIYSGCEDAVVEEVAHGSPTSSHEQAPSDRSSNRLQVLESIPPERPRQAPLPYRDLSEGLE